MSYKKTDKYKLLAGYDYYAIMIFIMNTFNFIC